MIGSPLHFSGAASGPQELGAPLAGEHTRAILGSIGYDEDDISALIASGTVVQQDAHT